MLAREKIGIGRPGWNSKWALFDRVLTKPMANHEVALGLFARDHFTRDHFDMEEIGHKAYRVPSAVEHEITSVQLLDPHSTVSGDWRFSDSLTTIRTLYRQLLTSR